MVVNDELGRVPRRVQKRNFGRPQHHVVQVNVRPLATLALGPVALTVTRMTSERKSGSGANFAEVAWVLLLPFPPPEELLLTSVADRFPELILTNFRGFFVLPVLAGQTVRDHVFGPAVLVRLPAMMSATFRLRAE